MVKSKIQESNLQAFESIWTPRWDFTVLKCPRETHLWAMW